MNKKLAAIMSACLIIAVVSPLFCDFYFNSYFTVYFNNKFDPVIASCNSKIGDLQSQIQDLQQGNANLMEENYQLINENKQLTNLTEPYLAIQLGWYLHTSSDQVLDSRDSFNIYGTILNVGVEDAENSSLVIGFYDNMTLLQTSVVQLGEIKSGCSMYLPNTEFGCSVADSVNRIVVTPQWLGQ